MKKAKKINVQQMIGEVNRHDIPSLQKMLAEGADPNATMNSTYHGSISILMCAAGVLFVDGVEALLKAGANANFCSIAGSGGGGDRTALYEAITGTDARPGKNTKRSTDEDRFKIVDQLLKTGANPNEVGKSENLPLYAAAHDGQYEICQRLIEAGATFKTWPANCGSPLVGAANGGFTGATKLQKQDKVIDLLLGLGAPVDGETVSFTPLMAAAYIGNEHRVNLFLDHGANVNRQDKYGRTPLIATALYCESGAYDKETEQIALRIVKRLLESGANPDTRNIKGESAFDIASRGKSSLVADYIKDFAENKLKAK